jgi:hypothetical protein
LGGSGTSVEESRFLLGRPWENNRGSQYLNPSRTGSQPIAEFSGLPGRLAISPRLTGPAGNMGFKPFELSVQFPASLFALRQNQTTRYVGIVDLTVATVSDAVPHGRFRRRWDGTTSFPAGRDFAVLNLLICGNFDNRSGQLHLSRSQLNSAAMAPSTPKR